MRRSYAAPSGAEDVHTIVWALALIFAIVNAEWTPIYWVGGLYVVGFCFFAMFSAKK